MLLFAIADNPNWLCKVIAVVRPIVEHAVTVSTAKISITIKGYNLHATRLEQFKQQYSQWMIQTTWKLDFFLKHPECYNVWTDF